MDGDGNLFIAEFYGHRVRRVAAGSGLITTVAGTDAVGFSGDGGAAAAARLNGPHGVCLDFEGNLLIAEYGGHRVRRIAAGTGVITTVAGTGAQGSSGDGGAATNALLNAPVFMVMEPTGDVLVSELLGHRVRRVAAGTGVITTVAGAGAQGFSGDGGAATSASLYQPAGLVLDQAGNLFIADNANHRVRKVAVGTGVISTVAGDGVPRFQGDLGAATSASLRSPVGLAFDQGGNLLIADGLNCRVRSVAAGTGVITSMAGTGACSFSGDSGAATSATFNSIGGIVLDHAGNLFIADRLNNRLRRVSAPTQPSSSPSVTPSSSSTKRPVSATPTRTSSPTATASGTRSSSPSYAPGVITTVAGSGAAGSTGDGGAATSAAMNGPHGVAIDTSGNLFFVDHNNHRVRRLAAGTGFITTVAGNGFGGFSGDGGAATTASLNLPHDVCFDLDGNLLIAEYRGYRVRKVALSTGLITTYAGTGVGGFDGDGGAATSARVSGPVFVVTEPTGGVLISEHDSNRVRRVAAGTGIITTVAGNGVAGFSGDGGAATSASLSGPQGLALDEAGNLFIADSNNNRVRKVAVATGVVSSVAGNGVAGFSGDFGAATSTSLSHPRGLAFDHGGGLLIVDTANCRVRRVAENTNAITTVAGNEVCGISGDGGAATSASLSSPQDIALDAAGNIYISDGANHRVRRVSAPTQPSSTPSATPSVTPYCAPSLFRSLPRTDLVGTLVGTALTPGEATLAASEAACRQACCDAPVCEGFAFELAATLHHSSAPCYLYVNVTQLMPTSSFQSGVLESVL
jgi:sugar lactone lactonase YvrE